ncbi:MAG: hypothetical protein AB8E15_14080 [Bdellovibrionales bacterium]
MAKDEFDDISILVISNSPKKYRLVLRQMTNMGLTCACLGNVKKALQYIVAKKPTHMFLSANMDKMNAIKVAKLLSTTFNLPVVLYPEDFGYKTTKYLKECGWPTVMTTSLSGASVANYIRQLNKTQEEKDEEERVEAAKKSKRKSGSNTDDDSDSPYAKKKRRRNSEVEDDDVDLYGSGKKKKRRRSSSGDEEDGDSPYAKKKRRKRKNSGEDEDVFSGGKKKKRRRRKIERAEDDDFDIAEEDDLYEYSAQSEHVDESDDGHDEDYDYFEEEYDEEDEAGEIVTKKRRRRRKKRKKFEELSEGDEGFESAEDFEYESDEDYDDYEEEDYEDELVGTDDPEEDEDYDYFDEEFEEEDENGKAVKRTRRKKRRKKKKKSEDFFAEADAHADDDDSDYEEGDEDFFLDDDDDEDDEDFDLEAVIRDQMAAKSSEENKSKDPKLEDKSVNQQEDDFDEDYEDEDEDEDEDYEISGAVSRKSKKKKSSGDVSSEDSDERNEDNFDEDEEYEYEEDGYDEDGDDDLKSFRKRKKKRKKKKKSSKAKESEEFEDTDSSSELENEFEYEDEDEFEEDYEEIDEATGKRVRKKRKRKKKKKEIASEDSSGESQDTDSLDDDSDELIGKSTGGSSEEDESSDADINNKKPSYSISANDSALREDSKSNDDLDDEIIDNKIKAPEKKKPGNELINKNSQDSPEEDDFESDWNVKTKAELKAEDLQKLQSSMSKAVNQILEPKGQMAVETHPTKNMVIFAAKAEHFSGYLVLAAGKDNIVSSELSGPFKKRLMGSLREIGLSLEIFDPLFIETEIVKYQKMMTELSHFVIMGQHGIEEVGFSFIETDQNIFQAEYDRIGTDSMYKVGIDTIEPNIPVKHDLFIQLKANKKFIKYCPTGGSIDEEQIKRLKKKNLTGFHLEQKDVKLWRSETAQNWLNNQFDDSEKPETNEKNETDSNKKKVS